MFDVEFPVVEGASGLQRAAQALGRAGVGLEGGGMWCGAAHYLVDDGPRARSALEAAGFDGIVIRPAVLADLDADVPGALGRMLARLVSDGVILLAQYSDHDNRKVLVADDPEAVRKALGLP